MFSFEHLIFEQDIGGAWNRGPLEIRYQPDRTRPGLKTITSDRIEPNRVRPDRHWLKLKNCEPGFTNTTKPNRHVPNVKQNKTTQTHRTVTESDRHQLKYNITFQPDRIGSDRTNTGVRCAVYVQ